MPRLELLEMFPEGKERRNGLKRAARYAVDEHHDAFVRSAISLDPARARGLFESRVFRREVRTAAERNGRSDLFSNLTE
ncbi:MAG: hypothetical protein AAGJ38_02200 [Planctomycetota bacterium]